MSKISLKSCQIQISSKAKRANSHKISQEEANMPIFGEVIGLPPISTHFRLTSILDLISTPKWTKINLYTIKVIILWTRGYF